MTQNDTAEAPLPGGKEALPAAYGALEKLRKLGRFLSTLKRVRAGDALWVLSNEEIEKERVLGAWEFNLLQSAASAVIATGFVHLVVRFLAPRGWSDDFFDTFANGILIPLSLAANAYAAAYGVLGSDRSNAEYAKVANAYLYLDGYFGLLFQTLTTTCVCIYLASGEGKALFGMAPWFLGIFVLTGLLQGLISQFVIPRRLLALPEAQTDGSANRRKWWAYQAYTLLAAGSFVLAANFIIEKVRVGLLVVKPIVWAIVHAAEALGK